MIKHGTKLPQLDEAPRKRNTSWLPGSLMIGSPYTLQSTRLHNSGIPQRCPESGESFCARYPKRSRRFEDLILQMTGWGKALEPLRSWTHEPPSLGEFSLSPTRSQLYCATSQLGAESREAWCCSDLSVCPSTSRSHRPCLLGSNQSRVRCRVRVAKTQPDRMILKQPQCVDPPRAERSPCYQHERASVS